MHSGRTTNWLLAVIAILLAALVVSTFRTGAAPNLVSKAHASGPPGTGVVIYGCSGRGVSGNCMSWKEVNVDQTGLLLVK